jgi:LmbE family N-acetylglucosaminyl deacetylase
MPEARLLVAVVVAHPDDETLWCGGYILIHPEFRWHVVTLCRRSDPDRAPKFRRILRRYGADGEMADLDDGPDQAPLPAPVVEQTVTQLLGRRPFDLILTHGPRGEYTRHRRHEECCQAVVALWRSRTIDTRQLWMFAYEDGGRAYLPCVSGDADQRHLLPEDVWREKRRLIIDVYGFQRETWEAQITPREEGFWCFDSAQKAARHAGLGELSS